MMPSDQWFTILSAISLVIAAGGFIEQLIYERQAVGDYHATKDYNDTIRFLALSRTLSTASLSLVHVTIVLSIFFIPHPAHPDLSTFEFLGLRTLISIMVIASTTINFLARARARRHVAAAG
jgi:hypothetical protein